MAEYIIGTMLIVADIAIIVVARCCPSFKDWVANLNTDEDDEII